MSAQNPFLTDTHTHLDLFEPPEVPDLLSRAEAAGVGRIVSVAINLESAKQALKISNANSGVFATAGVHPHEAETVDKNLINELKKIGKEPYVVAIGETGLDYYRMRSPKNSQIEALKRHLELAEELDLPVILHCRDAHDDMLPILEKERPPKSILHCFSGEMAQALAYINLGCLISLAGTVTFKNARSLQEVATKIPLDKLLLETDAPYLAPQKYRGQRNETSYVGEAAAKIAELRSKQIETIVNATTKNADNLFGDCFATQTIFDRG